MKLNSSTYNNRKINYYRGGSGSPLLLIHGGIGDAELHWSPVWSKLSAKFEVIAPNLPSFGGTSPLDKAGFAEIADWAADFIDALKIESVNVIGNSFGGGVGRLMASRHRSKVKRLILVNGGAIPNIPFAVGRAMQSRFFDGIFNVARRRTFSYKGLAPMFADKKYLTNDFIAKADSDSTGFVTLMRQSASGTVGEEVIPQVQTLVLWGEADRFTKVSMGRNLAEAMPKAEFKLIPNAGHMPQIEQPDEFVKQVFDFLG